MEVEKEAEDLEEEEKEELEKEEDLEEWEGFKVQSLKVYHRP